MQYKPLPADMQLGPTLARRVNQLREFRNLTVKDLARRVRFTEARIEDIESGLETWLSSTDRQMLAKALVVEPFLLQEVESRAAAETVHQPPAFDRSIADRLTDAILMGDRDLICPDCNSSLRASVQEGFDIEGRPIRLARAFCLKCPFILR